VLLQWKICIITPICGQIANIHASYRKSGSRNMMVTSNFRPAIEMWPLCACAMKNMDYLWTIHQYYHIWQEIGIKKLMAMSDFRPGVEIWRLRTWLWGRYHIPQDVSLVMHCFYCNMFSFQHTKIHKVILPEELMNMMSVVGYVEVVMLNFLLVKQHLIIFNMGYITN